MQVKHSGTWKNATPACKVGGSWVTPKEVWVKHAGVWKKEWSGSLYTITAQGYFADQYNAYTGWMKSSGLSGDLTFYDSIANDTVTPTELEPKATIMTAVVIRQVSDNTGWIQVVALDHSNGTTFQYPPNTTGWMAANTLHINGVGPFKGAWAQVPDAKAGTPNGTWFSMLDANGVVQPGFNLVATPAQLAAITAAAAQPNQLVFTFTKA